MRSVRHRWSRARRDLLVMATLVSAMALLIWNGSSFVQRLSIAEGQFSTTIKIAAVALSLNVALILFGWRRYVDLQHEAELRIDGEAARADPRLDRRHDRVAQPQGVRRPRRAHLPPAAARAARSSPSCRSRSTATSRSTTATAMRSATQCCGDCRRDERDVPAGAALARLSGDEFAVRWRSTSSGSARAAGRSDCCAGHPAVRGSGQVYPGRRVRSGFAGERRASTAFPTCCAAPISRWTMPRAAASARPVWFDGGMERALVAQSEIEQGIRFGLEHDQFVPLLRAAGRPRHRRDHRLRGARALEPSAERDHRPDRFIPVAEEIGLIGRLSEQIIAQGARGRPPTWDPSINISVNISPTPADRQLARAEDRPAC